jgi:AcrR family transcriptional regulator
MAKKTVYSREDIISTAVELVRKGGREALTARAIAKELDSSTMPIYSLMGSIEAIEAAVAEKAYALMKEFQKRQYTDDGLVDLGVGYVAFARDERRLFNFLYREYRPQPKALPAADDAINGDAALIGPPSNFADHLDSNYGDIRGMAAFSASIDPKALSSLAYKSWIFTHGLAELVAGGALAGLSNDAIADLLGEAGGAFYTYESITKGEKT